VFNKIWFKISEVVDDIIFARPATTSFTTGDMALRMFADIDRIDQAIPNFINNAGKYAPESKTIAAHLSKQDNTAKVSVSDERPGIPLDKLPCCSIVIIGLMPAVINCPVWGCTSVRRLLRSIAGKLGWKANWGRAVLFGLHCRLQKTKKLGFKVEEN
jgi:hypothetical protein